MAAASVSQVKDARIELTWRGIILGAAITIVFTAANVYLGLKIGLTFATSIPAAVISMAVLRAFRSATIFENNIVQTVASAAGTLSSIIFVLPGLVMVGWWTGFPYWESFAICATGGILGVMYSVPLRRALVAQSDLPYPEGVAAAEVLKVGVGAKGETAASIDENKKGLLTLIVSSLVSAGYFFVVQTRIFIDTLQGYARVGGGATGFGIGLSLALLGAGHLIGLAVGTAIFVGLFLAWGVLTPLLTALHPVAGDAATVATSVWAHQVRFIGAGTIGIAAIWTIIRLAKPVWVGVSSAIAASRARAAAKGNGGLPRTEQDLSIGTVGLISLACFIPIAALLSIFLNGTALASLTIPLVVVGVIYIVVAGFFVAAACGYMAGLIGSSNSPVSGLGILSVIGAALLLVVVAKTAGPAGAPALVAYALFVTAVLLNVATISNDNLQDLKTGQLVDATPWRQQVALIAGVIFGAIVIPPILSLLNKAYGFGAASAHALPAPQATLISALAKGVIQGQINWNLIGGGVVIGIVIIAIDEILRMRTKMQLPPLAVGLGIYLPASTTAMAVVGALIGFFYNRSVAGKPFGDVARRLGVLVASGFIVGESLAGVVLAGVIVIANNPTPFAVVGDSFATASNWLAAIGFIAGVYLTYRWTAGLAIKPPAR
ncbi:MAG TPA: oligopeptide transporter, OPT family [Candidatus Eremiobacteraceae bacterium]|nr:oligopeptide transporter, OPT family [Candidatus Eremiobacteraceae bacterium]